MSEGISDSRFYMWRAVFAMAHMDGVVTPEEAAFTENYFQYVPFSEAQKETLRRDLKEAQSVNAMLIGISLPSDMADFFQFAQMMVWSDKDYDEREQELIERLTAEQMNRFNKQELSRQIQEARKASAIRRAVEDEEFRKQAKELVWSSKEKSGEIMKQTAKNLFRSFKKDGLFGLIYNTAEKDNNNMHGVMEWMRQEAMPGPDPAMFNLWRAVFALVHADGKVTGEEREYIEAMTGVFRFSDEQRAQIAKDMQTPPNIASLFGKLGNAEMRQQFFKGARTILWCDGELHPQEREMMERLVDLAGAEVKSYKQDLEWLEKNPVMPADEGGDRQETAMRGLAGQMLGFARKRAA